MTVKRHFDYYYSNTSPLRSYQNYVDYGNELPVTEDHTSKNLTCPLHYSRILQTVQ